MNTYQLQTYADGFAGLDDYTDPLTYAATSDECALDDVEAREALRVHCGLNVS